MYSPSLVLSVASRLWGGVGCAQGHLCSMGKGSCSRPHLMERCWPLGQGAGEGEGAEWQLAPGLRIALGGISVLPICRARGPSPMGTPSSMLSQCFLPPLLLLLPVLGLIRTGAQHCAWAGWHSALLMQGWVGDGQEGFADG